MLYMNLGCCAFADCVDYDTVFNFQAALGFDHQEQLTKHESQKGTAVKIRSLWFYSFFHCIFCWNATIYVLDYSKGFGGKYGVQTDRQDQVRSF